MGQVIWTTGSNTATMGTDASGNLSITTQGSNKEITLDGAKTFSGPNKILFEDTRSVKISSSLLPASNSDRGPALTLGSATAPWKRIEADNIGMLSPVQNLYVGTMRITGDTISSTQPNSDDRKIILGSQFGTKVGVGTQKPQSKLHVEGDISSSGTYYGYQMVAHPMGESVTGAASRWLGFGPADSTFSEDTDTDAPVNRIMVPFDGYVHSVRLRAGTAPGNTPVIVAKIANGIDADTLDTAGSSWAAGSVQVDTAHTMFTWDSNLGPTATFNAGDVLGVKATFPGATGDVEGALVLMYKVKE